MAGRLNSYDEKCSESRHAKIGAEVAFAPGCFIKIRHSIQIFAHLRLQVVRYYLAALYQ